MADIVTNTLQIGNDNLILRDADAQERITSLKEDLLQSDIRIQPTYETLSGVIRASDGAVIGDLPNAHTSNIKLSAFSTIYVNSYNYTGHSILAKANGDGTYTSLVPATQNERKTTIYTADENMEVSCSYQTNTAFEIYVVNSIERFEVVNDSIKRTIAYNQIENVCDGVLFDGYWNGSGQRVSYSSFGVCNKNKIPCLEGVKVVIKANTAETGLTYYISYFDNSTRIQRDTGTGSEYTGTSPIGTKYVCFTFEKSGLSKNTFGTVDVFINNKLDAMQEQIHTAFNYLEYDGFEVPSYTQIDGIINDRGSVIGSSPHAHTSDIYLNRGDAVVVNGSYYSGFSIIAEHSGNYYIPLVKATANARVTAHYVAVKDMYVSVSYLSNTTKEIVIIRNNDTEVEETATSLNSMIDQSSVLWELGSIDGNGVDFDSTIRIRSEMIPVTEGSTVKVTGASNSICVFSFNKAKVLVGKENWIATNTFVVPSDVAYLRILLRVNPGDPTISSDDISTIRDRCTILLKMPQVEYYEPVEGAIPSYYSAMMKTKATQIRENMASIGCNGDSFIFFTDFHIDSNTLHSPSLIKYLMDNCEIRNVVFGGDAINKESTKEKVYEKFVMFNQLFKEQGINFKTVVGNHEFNNPSASSASADVAIQLSNGEVYPFFVKKEELNPFATVDASDLSFFVDNTTQKIRYIFIPCNYAGEITTSAKDSAIDIINATESGYGIVVFTHYALQYSKLTMHPSFTPIGGTLDNLIGSDVTPICIVTGHTHHDANGTTYGGIPIICTTCDAYAQAGSEETRTKGTVSEHAFDVFQINTSEKTIDVVRIGAGSDRAFTY